MGVYQIETDGGVYEIETDDGMSTAPVDVPETSMGDQVAAGMSGYLSGVRGLLDFGDQLNPMNPGGPKFWGLNPVAAKLQEGKPDLSMANVWQQGVNKITGVNADEIGKDTAIHTAASYVPGFVIGPENAAKNAIQTALMSGGATVGKKIGGTPGEIVGGLAGGLSAEIPNLVKPLIGMGRRALIGATPQEAEKIAANTLKEYTGLTANQLDDAMAAAPKDELGAMMTTAEITDNAPIAQLEKTLSREGKAAETYSALQGKRNLLRENLLDDMSSVSSVEKEALGGDLMSEAANVKSMMALEEGNVWAGVPRYSKVDVTDLQKTLGSITSAKQGGLEPGSKIKTLVDQLMDSDMGRVRTSGMLQDVRSDALALTRDANLSPYERRLLNSIQEGIDSSMEKGLRGKDYDAWKLARETTSENRGIFSRGTAGNRLLLDTTSPATALQSAFRGDTKSIAEIRAAVRDKPELIERVKRGILDSIPRDAQGLLTPAKTQKFLVNNEGGLRSLLGEEHFGNLSRLAKDLQSQAKVQNLAYTASKGNSITAQSTTVAKVLQDSLATKIVPSGPIGEVIQFLIKNGAMKTEAQVKEKLLQAALDPSVARDLLAKGTPENVSRGLNSLVGMILRTTAGAIPQDPSSVAEPAPALELKSPSAGRIGPSSPGSLSAPDRQEPKAKLIGPSTSQNPTKTGDFSQGDNMPITPEVKKVLESKDVKKIEALIDSDPVDAAIYEMESSRNPLAKNPTSSASGGFQLIKSTAKKIGVKDVFDLGDNYEGYLKLKEEHQARFGNDPALLYGAHYLGSTVLNKYLKGLPLTGTQQDQVDYFKSKVLPKFMKIYNRISSKTVEA